MGGTISIGMSFATTHKVICNIIQKPNFHQIIQKHLTKLLAASSSLLCKSGNRGIHTTRVKSMGGGGHGHDHNDPYAYMHFKHMYNLDRMKGQKIKMPLAVFTAFSIGIFVPLWAPNRLSSHGVEQRHQIRRQAARRLRLAFLQVRFDLTYREKRCQVVLRPLRPFLKANRGIHTTGVKRMSGGHAHGHDEPFYLHAKHMYNLDRMKGQKIKMPLAVFSAVFIGTAVPIWAVHFQQKKTASG
ncbi:hypothetical protein Tsubulata_024162 [Turnera subulata]|uniref:Uncharacterized protein n=1 Tax=Turnera subulata TaxID=218843 RepID=A0A9Q0GK45_9ROSI|nr:hypothetical protein Tsubulata_024162 [Turnera subulata]